MRRRLKSASCETQLIVIAAILMTGCARERGTPPSERVVTVCDVLANPSSFRGRIVAVRGVFTYGALRQDDCPQEFITGDRRWPPILNLATTEYQKGEPPVAFKTDPESWDRLDLTALEAGKQGRSVEIWATIIGQIRAQSEYVLPDGRVRSGFGHLGAFPAEVVVKQITDITVKPVPKSRYDYRLRKPRPG